MAIRVDCPGCGGVFQAPEEFAGRDTDCPTCRARIRIQPILTPYVKPPAKPPSTCKECGGIVSWTAEKCPHCGRTNPTLSSGHNNFLMMLYIAAMLAAGMFFIIMGLSR